MRESIYFDGRHYDALWPGLQRQEELDFYRRQISSFGEPVLELGCGTGQLTLALAQTGINIAGLDVSESMLSLAAQKSQELNLAIRWVRADCCDFNLHTRFGAIFFPANALQHLLKWTDLESCLTQVRDHLEPGGGFVFEIFNPSFAFLTRDPDKRYPVGEYADPDTGEIITVTENNRYDAASQVNHIRWFYRAESQAEETTAELKLRMYYPQEIDALLHFCGFRLLAKFGEYDETPFVSSSNRQLIVCAPV